MNKLKNSLDLGLTNLTLSSEIKDKLMQGQFKKGYSPLRLMPVAAAICACAVIIASIPFMLRQDATYPNGPTPKTAGSTIPGTNPWPGTTVESSPGNEHPSSVENPSSDSTSVDGSSVDGTSTDGPISTTVPSVTETTRHTYPTTYPRPPIQPVVCTQRSFGSYKGDFDGDGKQDTIFIDPASRFGTITLNLKLGNGKTISTTSGNLEELVCIIFKVVVADVNHDGRDDLIMAFGHKEGIWGGAGSKSWYYGMHVYSLMNGKLVTYAVPVRGVRFDGAFQDGFVYTIRCETAYPRQMKIKEYTANQYIKDHFYNADGTSAEKGITAESDFDFEIVSIGGNNQIRLKQLLFVSANKQKTIGTCILPFDFNPQSNTFEPADFDFAAQDYGQPEVSLPNENASQTEMLDSFLEGWKRKDVVAVNKYASSLVSGDCINEWAIQNIDISAYRYEKKANNVYTVYLDIDKSNVKGFPEGKNRQYSLVFSEHSGICEFTLAEQPVVACMKGEGTIPGKDVEAAKTKLNYWAYLFLSRQYCELKTGPIEIDMNHPDRYNGTKQLGIEGYFDFANMIPDLFSKQDYQNGNVSLSTLRSTFEKMMRFKFFNADKVQYAGGDRVAFHSIGQARVNMAITKVVQDGNVYILSIDLYGDSLGTVVARSLDLTMIDNGDGTYFFDRIDITYTSPYPIMSIKEICTYWFE